MQQALPGQKSGINKAGRVILPVIFSLCVNRRWMAWGRLRAGEGDIPQGFDAQKRTKTPLQSAGKCRLKKTQKAAQSEQRNAKKTQAKKGGKAKNANACKWMQMHPQTCKCMQMHPKTRTRRKTRKRTRTKTKKKKISLSRY